MLWKEEKEEFNQIPLRLCGMHMMIAECEGTMLFSKMRQLS